MNRTSQLLFLALLPFAACSDADAGGTEGIPAAPPSAAAQKLVLANDPGETQSVVDAKSGGLAENVVVAGRIRHIVKGFAAFTLMDLEQPYCGEARAEGCLTPWDYCCDNAKVIAANSLAIEARNADGQPIATPALPDLRLLDAVKVTGKLTKDEHGNYTLLATGIFRTERPELPDGLRWPQ